MASRRTVAWLAASLLANAAIAGMEWQLIDPGVPLSGTSVHLFHMARSGVTFLRIENEFMIPHFWTLEGDTWIRRLETEFPVPRFKASLVYDPVRDVVVRFGGADPDWVFHNETWEFDGTSWVERTDVGAPPPRIRAVMAYDTDRNVMVLFGGYRSDDQALEDTWEYDGVAWQQRNLVVHPPARYDAIMSYDEKRRAMVLAFGLSTTGAYNDTWEFNGTRWTKPNVHNPPAERWEASSAYDPIRRSVYVFGSDAAGETLRWTGSSWDLVPIGTHPPGRHGAAMIFDAARGKVLLYGGYFRPSNSGDTWEFDGTDWTQLPLLTHQAKRTGAGAAFDPVSGRAVLFGGCCEGGETGTAEWDGATWSEVLTSPNPGQVSSPALDASPAERVLLFGGFRGNAAIDETWSYDPSSDVWTELFSGIRPAPRHSASMVYSPAHGGSVLFGGWVLDKLVDDTWVYAGGVWRMLAPPVRPTWRSDYGLAADTWRGNVVLYGGAYGNGLSDTWILTGEEWVLNPAVGPGIRIGPGMTFDPLRGVSVLFGGVRSPDPLQRTWEFDGTVWTPRTTTYSPDAFRASGTMFWDPVRGVAVLTGGYPRRSAGSDYSDTWVYGPDDDGDLRVGGYDNCPQISNAEQGNSDLDARGDLCDCAPADSGSWDAPAPVRSLVASGSSLTSLSWEDQSAVVGPGVMYDVVTGSLLELRNTGSFASTTCLASHLGAPSASDSRTPAVADGFYYLVRARNACGLGTFERSELDASSLCP